MWWMSIAWGAPLVPTWTVGSHRAVKVDLFGFGPALHPWGSDWKATRLEQWTLVFDCETTADRVERCTFLEKPSWGYVVDETDVISWVSLPAPPSFEIVWTKTGRVQSYDPAVDPGAFGDAAADAQLQALFHRSDVVFKPDGKREIGSSIWTNLVRDAVTAMELELSKKGEDSTWSWTKPPTITRRYVQGIASGKVDNTVGATTADGVAVAMTGRVSETLPSGGASGTVDTQVVGSAVVDPATGRPVRLRWDTVTTSTSVQLTDHTRHLVLLEPWAPGQPTDPAPMPQPAL